MAKPAIAMTMIATITKINMGFPFRCADDPCRAAVCAITFFLITVVVFWSAHDRGHAPGGA